MKTYKEFSNTLSEGKPTPSAMRSWVYYNLENTNASSSEMRKKFAEKFGSNNMKYFDQYVSSYMD